jgi:hypothetical protein
MASTIFSAHARRSASVMAETFFGGRAMYMGLPALRIHDPPGFGSSAITNETTAPTVPPRTV